MVMPDPAPSGKHALLNSTNPVFMDIIEGLFLTPSGNYFLHRKLKKVGNLVHAALQSLPESHQKRLFVEIGCGKATDLFHLRPQLASHADEWSIVGIDADPTSLHLCELKQQFNEARDVQFQACDITGRLPFDDHSVDFLYCSEVIEHLADPDLLIAEFARVLKKPGGLLLLTTPNEPNVFQRTYWSARRRQALKDQMESLKQESRQVNVGEQNAFILGHVSLRTIDEWNRALKKAGFSMVSQKRGAISYGATRFYDNEWVLGVRFLLEGLLDLLPVGWVYNFSDQLIGLYRLDH